MNGHDDRSATPRRGVRRGAWAVGLGLWLTAASSAAATPPQLEGKTLSVIPRDEVVYQVKQVHVREGASFPGEFSFTFDLSVSLDGAKLKLEKEKYEGTGFVPVRVVIRNLEYGSASPGAPKRRHAFPDAYCAIDWDEARSDVRCRRGDPSSGEWGFTGVLGLQVVNAWLPALAVQFPDRLTLTEGFSWGEPPKQAVRRYEDVSYLQCRTVSKVAEDKGGFLVQFAAQSEVQAGPDKDKEVCAMRRAVTYDTRRGLVVRASVTFEKKAGPKSEKVEILMELREKR